MTEGASRRQEGRYPSEKVQERESKEREMVAGILGVPQGHRSLANPGEKGGREVSVQRIGR